MLYVISMFVDYIGFTYAVLVMKHVNHTRKAPMIAAATCQTPGGSTKPCFRQQGAPLLDRRC